VRLRDVAIAGLLLLAGCAAGVPETPQEREARFQAACNQAGFKADTEAYKLCLLIQQQNDRLDAVERRLGFIQSDLNSPPLFYPYPHRWW
jgi:hypothetical protein